MTIAADLRSRRYPNHWHAHVHWHALGTHLALPGCHPAPKEHPRVPQTSPEPGGGANHAPQAHLAIRGRNLDGSKSRPARTTWAPSTKQHLSPPPKRAPGLGGGANRVLETHKKCLWHHHAPRGLLTRSLARYLSKLDPASPRHPAPKQHPRAPSDAPGARRRRKSRCPDPFNNPIAPSCFKKAADAKP